MKRGKNNDSKSSLRSDILQYSHVPMMLCLILSEIKFYIWNNLEDKNARRAVVNPMEDQKLNSMLLVNS